MDPGPVEMNADPPPCIGQLWEFELGINQSKFLVFHWIAADFQKG